MTLIEIFFGSLSSRQFLVTIQSELIQIINQANTVKASDVHFVMRDNKILMQFRVDSLMLPQRELTLEEYQQLLAYIKFHAALTLTHPRQPHSGILTLEHQGKTQYLRVSILPTYYFHSLVLRIINSHNQKSLEDIPFFKQNVAVLQDMAASRAGLLLISGPTGSGKTTTAYSLIQYLRHELDRSIITIEDPIEYQQEDIVQMQVNEDMGMTYDIGIKEILRHDPDVIVIGEIRDSKAAQQALRAALTGHLVISTIHAKNIVGTLYRLLDLGISHSDLEQTVIGLVNQRLIRDQNDFKALFEVCFGQELDLLLEQIEHGSLAKLPFKTLDEEFLKWQTIAG